jgi:hypothetical protein
MDISLPEISKASIENHIKVGLRFKTAPGPGLNSGAAKTDATRRFNSAGMGIPQDKSSFWAQKGDLRLFLRLEIK